MLVLAALIVMSSSWFQHVLERHIIASLATVTGGRVEIGHFRFRPWLFEIQMENLVIHGSEARGTPLVSAREVEAAVSPGQFLRQRIRLRHLDIDTLQVYLRTNSQGITNLPSSRERPSPQPGWVDLMDLSIGRLTVSHSTFIWNDQRLPVELDTREMAILVSSKRGHYSGTLSSSATTLHSRTWSTPPITFNSRFDLSRTSLVFSSFAWQVPGTAGNAAFTILPRPALQASGSFHTSADLPRLARILHAPELHAGTLQCEGHVVYQGGTISAQGRAQAHQMVLSTPAFPSLRLEAATKYAVQNRQINLTNLVIATWGGTVVGRLQADFANTPAKCVLTSQLHEVRLSDVLGSARTPPLLVAQLHPDSLADGALRATWSGQWQGLKADFDLAFKAPAARSANTLPVSGTARGTFEDRQGVVIHLADSELRTPHSTLTASGTLTQRGSPSTTAQPLALKVSTNDFEEWRPFFQALIAAPSGIPLGLQSQADFFGLLSGTAEEPSLRGRITMGQFRYQGWKWDRLAAGVTLNPGLIQVSDGRVQHEKSTFELSGSARLDRWRLTPHSELRFTAQAQRTPIEGLRAAVNSDLPVRGFVTGRVDVQGTVTTLAGSGAVRIDAGAIADEPFDSLSTRLEVAQSVWRLQNIELQKKRGRLSGDISLEPGRRFVSGRLKGTGFSLADIHRLSMIASPTLPEGGLEGNINFEAEGQGTPENFHVQSSWHVLNLRVAGTPLGELHGTVTGDGSQLNLEGVNRSPTGNLRFSASARAQGDWPMEAHGEYSDLHAGPWIRAFFRRAFGAVVTLNGSFQAAGPLRTPEKITLQSQVREVAVNFPSVLWQNAQPVEVQYAAGKLSLSRLVIRGPFTELEIEGGMSFDSGPTLALRVEGNADATVLRMLDSSLDASGHCTLHLQLTGMPASPSLNGVIDVHNVSLDYTGLPFRFNNLEGTISLEGQRAVIRSLRGSSGGGTVSLSGFVTLTDNPRFDGRAELSQVRVRYPTDFTSVLDGSLRLTGDASQGELQGDLVVRQMVLNQNVNFISQLIESANPISQAPTAATSPLASQFRLNIRVTSSPPIQVQTPNMRLVGDVDLRLRGTLASPVQVGAIHLLSGESVFRGNRYTLVRGDINLTNPFRTQASLDMEVQTRVQSYDLTLDISGPFERLKFSYRSDPPLAQTDIISLLALGYVQQEQAFPALQGNPATSVGASAILSQALSTQIGGRIQHLFGVSRIKIDPYVGMPGLGSGERVTVEEQITHDLTLTYITDTSYSQYTIYQFEWNVTDNVSILGVRDPNGIFGLEFRFRRRFK